MSQVRTVADVIKRLTEALVPELPAETVDTIKAGDPNQPITGIVTTFLVNFAVIEQAAALNANLIITHEPTYYNHLDQIDGLQNDPVYLAKRSAIDANRLVIWRCHDTWHMHRPDGIITGVLQDLGWERYAHPERPFRCAIPPTSFHALVAHLKEVLDIDTVRVIGDDNQICQNVGLLVGAAGGAWHIRALREENLDTLIVGEINEWETSEYIRDARSLGMLKSLIILGHEKSEEAGMRNLADMLRGMFPEIPVTHVPSGDPFRFL